MIVSLRRGEKKSCYLSTQDQQRQRGIKLYSTCKRRQVWGEKKKLTVFWKHVWLRVAPHEISKATPNFYSYPGRWAVFGFKFESPNIICNHNNRNRKRKASSSPPNTKAGKQINQFTVQCSNSWHCLAIFFSVSNINIFISLDWNLYLKVAHALKNYVPTLHSAKPALSDTLAGRIQNTAHS